jgi:hypothetical protein
MKKIFILLFGLVAANQVFAQATGTACGSGATNVVGDPALFVRVDVVPKCSANVIAIWSQTANGFAVASSSSKGKHNFTGNTGGGAVAQQGVCATATPCDAAKLAAPLAAAVAAAT